MTGKRTTDDSDTVNNIVVRCSLIFARRHPAIQGAALAQLLAIWLAGHRADGGGDEIRERLLVSHLKHVREFLKIQLELT